LTVTTQAQNVTDFTAQDNFAIPEKNGSISFATNGSYVEAKLQDHTWTFSNLSLGTSQNRGTLKISAENSNITITDYRIGVRSQLIRYIAEGQGTQTINFINDTKRTHPTEWTVIVSSTNFLAEGKDWTLRSDNTIVVNEQSGNVSILHYRFEMPDNSDQPFYIQHSVALITAAVLAATTVTATIITVKLRRK